MSSLEYVRQATPADERERAREKVAAAARRGEDPRSTFPLADLEWAFRGCEDELAQLGSIAEQERTARARRIRERDAADELRDETNRVLKQWDIAEQAERRAKAEAEARQRIAKRNA
jgi:hypothetical protein